MARQGPKGQDKTWSLIIFVTLYSLLYINVAVTPSMTAMATWLQDVFLNLNLTLTPTPTASLLAVTDLTQFIFIDST